MKKLKVLFLVLLFLFATTFSMFINAQGSSEYTTSNIQDFESMTSSSDLSSFFTGMSYDEDSTCSFGLDSAQGYGGSKAMKIDFGFNFSWGWIRLDRNITANGEGMSFWVKSNAVVTYRVLFTRSDYTTVQHEQNLVAGENNVQFLWSDLNIAPGSDVLMSIFLLNPGTSAVSGTVYLDNIAYLTEDNSTTTIDQDFNAMNSSNELSTYFTGMSYDEDSTCSLGLDSTQGYGGSKAMKVDFGFNFSWGWIRLDRNITANGEGMSFWVKSNAVVTYRVLFTRSDYTTVQHEQNLVAGENNVQFLWSDLNIAPGSDVLMSIFLLNPGTSAVSGTVYLDNIAYLTEDNSTTTIDQDFNAMNSSNELSTYFTGMSYDEDSTCSLGLDSTQGYGGSKAMKVDFGFNFSWGWIRLDRNITANGEGMSFWVKSNAVVTYRVLFTRSDYTTVQHEQNLVVGENNVQFLWSDLNIAPGSDVLMSIFLLNPGTSAVSGTVYLDNIAFIAGNANSLSLEIDNYFPELPGHSTDYEFCLKVNGVQRDKNQFTLSTNPSSLAVNGNVVTATDQQKNTYDGFIVTARDHITGDTVTYTIYPKKWQISFSDEFSGSYLDNSKWLVEFSNTSATVANGLLTLLAEKIDRPGQEPIYTISGVSTRGRFTQKFGCFVTRMKTPDRGGCNSGFWLMPDGAYMEDAFFTDAEYPNMGCSEIDIVEYSPFFGNSYTATMHFWDRNTGEHLARGNWIETPQLIYPDYHEYACIWNEDGIYFYFDGKPYLANEAIFTPDDAVEAYTFLSNNSARIHEGLEWLGPCTDDMFPFVATFDWVRIYR